MYSSTCTNKCPDGFFGDLTSGTCEECKEACLTCDDRFTCSTCPQGAFLHEQLCLENCPDNFFESKWFSTACNKSN